MNYDFNTPRFELPTCPADLDGMTCIASATSRADGKDTWTDLSLWYRSGHDRPYITVIEGKAADEAKRDEGLVDRFRAHASGALAKAIALFDPSDLRDELVNAIPEDADRLYPDSNTIRMREADERRADRGYQGKPTLTAALEWLYPGLLEGASINHVAKRFETDFGIGERVSRKIIANERADIAAPTWVNAFVAALRHFDRKAWRGR